MKKTLPLLVLSLAFATGVQAQTAAKPQPKPAARSAPAAAPATPAATPAAAAGTESSGGWLSAEKGQSIGFSGTILKPKDGDAMIITLINYSRFINDRVELSGILVGTDGSGFESKSVGVGGRLWFGETRRTGLVVPFAEAGAQLMMTKFGGGRETELALAGGGGVAYFLNENTDGRVTAMYTAPVSALGDFLLNVTVGLTYYF